MSELIGSYDGLLCDIWGVLHNGEAAFSHAVDALYRVRASGRVVILITNAPRLSKEIYPQLARFGVPREAFDTVITSGDVTAQLIARQPNAPLFHFGPKRDKSVLEGLTNPIVDHSDAKLCLLTGPLDDTIVTAEVYHALLEKMHKNAVELICANPDLVVRSGNRMVICAGSIAQRYAHMGGKVSFAGKPEPSIYDEALRRAASLTGRDIPKSRLLAIGDGLATDIKGAADNGFDAYFVFGGIHASEFEELTAQEAVNRIKTKFLGLNLVGVTDRLSWN
ncbi:TIGR01459 family HAD-type hydrolase [Sulfitobacter sp. F26169L]|uniref:TIGR01459 family HAD-type hydrolase n=1 Tax=Sulfitobacter sp. F26169L TaxID=2996015 RepID=UPI00226081D0|nr:TIGR01459 family HAD-type hydrolase [Sulfitobacter sp. F26169L]MCX7565569.1 TIGR01459 family HAD-type hydrolase [Sulfitobacter sp. F26169L]